MGLLTEKNSAAPVWRDASGGKHYDDPDVLKCLTLAEKLLIARLSVAVTIHHLAHGGVASAGHVATSPKPVEAMAAVPPKTPIRRNNRPCTSRRDFAGRCEAEQAMRRAGF